MNVPNSLFGTSISDDSSHLHPQLWRLEYGSTVWSPFYTVHKYALERVQRRFLRYIGFKLGIPSSEINYESLLQTCGLQTLETRRQISDISVMYKLVNNGLDSPYLLSRIAFRIPQSTRSTLPFLTPFSATNYLLNRPLCRLPRLANYLTSLNPDLDFFFSPFSSFKSAICASQP
ncbi:hypothetical protein GE061_013694 [Apolygus lucorum]|uniref:Uncharacterized protein n=1 Tax=Apolygus lucorum TaxID=248454 RepID=A0A8S9XQS3_APOLU|nr:hypothetical protein GE061_013694 [Apolygus lucorum]